VAAKRSRLDQSAEELTFGEKVVAFNQWLRRYKPAIPAGTTILLPFSDQRVMELSRTFYGKYFNDRRERHMLLGINPGRFGAGLTGIPFTDPVRLADSCDIPNHLDKKQELSSDFIYRMIENMGGPRKFYRDFFITSVCPLGFMRDGVNLNYYDDPELLKAVEPFIVRSLKRQLDFGCRREAAFIIGEGKNLEVFSRMNQRHGFFGELIALAHPRFILQYRRKQTEEYLRTYCEKLESVL
jgi:hypothetical protein